MDEDAHRSATADQGPATQALPPASPGTADPAEEAFCPQATHQPEAETCAVQATRGTGRTAEGDQGTTCITDDPLAVRHEEQTKGAANGAGPPQAAAAEECVQCCTATGPAQVGTHDNLPPGAPETEENLASIFNDVALTADQPLQTDEHLHNNEFFAAFMASCPHRATTGAGNNICAAARGSQHQGDLNRVDLPFFPISNQPNFQPITPAEISKLTTHSSPSEHGNDTNNSN